MRNDVLRKMTNLGVAAGFLVASAYAAEAIDYSTYVQLNTSPSLTGSYPPAANWTPSTDMATSPNECYFVPTNRTIYTKNGSGTSAGSWPCAEFAIAGAYKVNVSSSRAFSPSFTGKLALLSGATVTGMGSFSTISASAVEVRATAENPAKVLYSYTNDKSTAYCLQIDAPLTSADASAVIRFERTGSDDYDLARGFRLTKGCADYLGTIVVAGARTWLRDADSSNFDIGGTLKLTEGGNLHLNTQSPTFGSLVVESGSTVELVGGKTITVNGLLSIADGAIVKVDKLTSTDFAYDNGSNVPPEIPVISVCGAENAAKVDRDGLLAAIHRAGITFKGAPAFSIPWIRLVEKTREDGGADFCISYDVVQQVKKCSYGSGPYGYEMYEDYLSDKLPISHLKDYYSSVNIYFNSPYEFPGRSLTISGFLGLYSAQTFTAGALRALDGAGLGQMDKNGNAYLRGNLQLDGALDCRAQGSKPMFIESDLSGSGDLRVVFYVGQAVSKKSASCGIVELKGENAAWTGRVLVGCGRDAKAGEIGLTNLTLRVAAGGQLGGGLDVPVFDSLKVADTCTFAVADSTVFDAANRGWCLMDGSTVDVATDKTATVKESVTFGGTVTKAGAGTLVLGGPSRAYDAENDAPVDAPNGAELVVAAGGLGAAAADAFAGLSSLTFAAGAQYVVSAANASGADLLAVALTVPSGGVPVEFTDIPENGAAITVATFATAEDAAKFAFVKPRGYIATRSVEEIDGKFLLKAVVEKSGLSLIIR